MPRSGRTSDHWRSIAARREWPHSGPSRVRGRATSRSFAAPAPARSAPPALPRRLLEPREVPARQGHVHDFERGHFTAIMGPSGSGKSTLMHLLAGLDTATSGHAFIGDTEVTGLNDNALTQLRRDRVGFVFQSFNLLPMFTAEQNITLPVELAGGKVDRAWFETLVRTLGLEARLSPVS